MVDFNADYYKNIIKEYDYDPIEIKVITFDLGGLSQRDLQTQWICHFQGTHFANLFNSGTKSIATTGFGLSGPPHMGTISQIMKAIRLQRGGIPVQIVLGDLDAVNGKSIEYEYTQELVVRYKKFIRTLGFIEDTENILRSQTEELDVLKTSYLIGHEIEDDMFTKVEEDLHDFYKKRGKVDSTMSYRRKLSLNLMIADFVHLLAGKYDSVLVFLGIDEHKYVHMASDVVSKLITNGRLKEKILASMYSSIIKGLNGYPKMSKSFPESSIHVSMTPDQIRQCVLEEKNVKTPEDNVIYQMLSTVSYFTYNQISEAYECCKLNNNRWNKFKKDYVEQLVDIIQKW